MMSQRPLPDFARAKLTKHSKVITALFPGARNIQFLNLGMVRMQFVGNLLWQRTPWKIMQFESLFTNSDLFWSEAPRPTRLLENVIEIILALEIPHTERLMFFETPHDLHRAQQMFYPM